MRASALVLLALGGALAFSSAPAEPRDSRTSYSGTLPPCADGNSFDCTDSPAMLIGGHSGDHSHIVTHLDDTYLGEYSQGDTSLDGSYLGSDEEKRCVEKMVYDGCLDMGSFGNGHIPLSSFASCRVPCLAECFSIEGWDDPSPCAEGIVVQDDAFCAKYRARDKYKGQLPDSCCAEDEAVVRTNNDPCYRGPGGP